MKIDWEQAAEDGFANLTLKQLKEACDVFGVKYHHASKESKLRDQLCAAVGKPAMKDRGDQQKPKVIRGLAGFDLMPNLTSNGKWGGRMQRVRLNKLPNEDDNTPGLMLGWDGVPMYVFYDREVDIPEPYFHALADARGANISTRTRTREGGGVSVTQVESPFQAHPFQHIGVTPGTEHLPRDIFDYWQTQAKKHDGFAGCTRHTLSLIYASCTSRRVDSIPKDMDEDELRWQILNYLHLPELMGETA